MARAHDPVYPLLWATSKGSIPSIIRLSGIQTPLILNRFTWALNSQAEAIFNGGGSMEMAMNNPPQNNTGK
jgi:hypothetical protein